MADRDLREAPTLLADTLRHLSSLVQNELALIRAELRQSITSAGIGVAFFVAAALMALVALNVLASALVAWVASAGLSVGLAALFVGGGLLIVAAILALLGKSRLSADALEPTRSMNNVQKDVAAVKEASHA